MLRLLLCFCLALCARAADPLKALEWLQGEWTGEGGGDPGQGKGGFSFRLDLDRHVLVRKNFSDYPATKDRPAAHHEDLMIVHPDAGGKLAAIYFDNEGHVIRYQVTASERSATFLSDALAATPRYRLTYTMTASDTVNIRFEIAPPGKPEEFKTYLTAGARRK